VLTSHHRNQWQNNDIMTANKSIGNTAKLKYLKTAVTSQNYIQEVFPD
jgi:hypothetical protein